MDRTDRRKEPILCGSVVARQDRPRCPPATKRRACAAYLNPRQGCLDSLFRIMAFITQTLASTALGVEHTADRKALPTGQLARQNCLFRRQLHREKDPSVSMCCADTTQFRRNDVKR